MPDEPDDRMDPLEALRTIRVLVDAASDQVEGTPGEPTFREIRNVLDKALGPMGRRRKVGKPQ